MSSTEFLSAQLGRDVAALLCSPLEFNRDVTGGDKTMCMGAQYIKWGPKVDSKLSALELTAKTWGCLK